MPGSTKEQELGERALFGEEGLGSCAKRKEIHHKVPLSKGGSDTLPNVQMIDKGRHKEIHKKSNLQLKGWLLQRMGNLRQNGNSE
jgi:hypothetical protein